STLCDKNPFTAGSGSTVTLTSSPKYFNLSLYIETLPSWQSICTRQPLGTNVVTFSTGACYNISGTVYAPADNIVLGSGACSTVVGPIVAWTLVSNGSGTP